MKTLILAAFAALALGAAAADAEGLPFGTEPQVYASGAFPNQTYHNRTVFSELFNRASNNQTSSVKTLRKSN